MPLYVYQYTNAEGETKTVDKRFKMSEYPQKITVEEGDEIYTAHLIPAVNSRMKIQWDTYEPSDLPPINHPPVGPEFARKTYK